MKSQKKSRWYLHLYNEEIKHISVCVCLQGAPGEKGERGEPGDDGYQVSVSVKRNFMLWKNNSYSLTSLFFILTVVPKGDYSFKTIKKENKLSLALLKCEIREITCNKVSGIIGISFKIWI